jgi:RNA polymerase sigma-70 factor (ECF subfamily)
MSGIMPREESTLANAVSKCLQKTDSQAWAELVRLLHPVFARVAFRVVAEWGLARNATEIEDIVQEAFLKLVARGGEVLARVPLTNEQSALAYFKVIAANCAHDYLKARHAEKRGLDRTASVDAAIGALTEVGGSGRQERDVLIAQVDAALKADRWERSVFWLYYRQGFTAKEISALPGCDLGAKGVESLIFRLTAAVRRSLGRRPLELRNSLEGESAPESL